VGRNRIARHGPLRIAYEVCGPRLRRAPWLVLIDNRGTGRSTAASGQFSVADLARDVTAVLDSNRIGRAHVLGVSLGGMVAQRSLVENALSPDTLVEQPGLRTDAGPDSSGGPRR
jgi:pimeloyl-ACP methyl ester carboxylesterase